MFYNMRIVILTLPIIAIFTLVLLIYSKIIVINTLTHFNEKGSTRNSPCSNYSIF